jgi:hypothetical protein
MTLYPDPIKLKKYPILSQILTPFCPKIKGSIHYLTLLSLLIIALLTTALCLFLSIRRPHLAILRLNSLHMRRMNPNLQGNLFLFHSRLKGSLNLIPLYQTEVSVFFGHKQSKDCTSRSNGKMPLKAL